MTDQPRIAYLTAGGAGMFCGSCMRDNTLAAELIRLGCDVQLVPLYTPIRTDEEDVSVDRVFFGGVNVYLQQKVPWLGRLPGFVLGWLDHPWLIRRVSSWGIQTSGRQLGGLAVSVLKGEQGNQRAEVERLIDWLAGDARPHLVNLSNILIGGCLPAIQRRLNVPVLVTLQGDDLFLEDLVQPYKDQALAEVRRLAGLVDGFLVFSRYYAQFMSEYLQAPIEKFHIVPMGLALGDYRHEPPPRPADRPPTVGYLARLCPAKGLHFLVEAFLLLRKMPGTHEARLRVAGWLSTADKPYADEQFARLAREAAGSFDYAGVLERPEKLDFLRSIDVLSVPTVYREPKGIFVLEALASGVPVVQPAHGAFPELLAATGGGRLVRPGDPAHLAESLHELLTDDARRAELALRGRQRVHADFGAEKMALATLEVYRKF
ncbi:MAG: glycosyltransferase family 4 protein [Pirellulales bacterium]